MSGKLTAFGLAIVVVIVAIWFGPGQPLLHRIAETSNGYGAKIGCSIVFVANRSIESAIDQEFFFPPIRFVSSLSVDRKTKCVTGTSKLVPSLSKTACWRSKRLGCHLMHDDIKQYPLPPEPREQEDTSDLLFPLGDKIDPEKASKARSEVDIDSLSKTVEEHFNDTRLHARAFLVIKDGHIIYEKYGPGFGPKSVLLGWSMTKSWINALIGIRQRQGKIRLDGETSALLSHLDEKDPRGKLSLERLMRMADGLDFDEYYYPMSDVPETLFIRPSLVMRDRKLRVSHDHEHYCFQYSSHTTNMLSQILRESFDKHEDYLNFAAEEFFDKVNMKSAVLETDPSGTFIGSSFGWATARDWARFGMLYLQDGVWKDKVGNENRILPEGWVDFSKSVTETSDGYYGAQFWLGGGGGGGPNAKKDNPEHVATCNKIYPSRLDPPRNLLKEAYPSGVFMAMGFEEQVVAIVPERNVVVVRLGQTRELFLNWDKRKFYSEIFKSLM